MKSLALWAALLLGGAAAAIAEDMPASVNTRDIKWLPAPDNLPKGAELAVISGDPFKEGLYVMRLKVPANYKIAPHTHPGTEYLTVLSGDFSVGMGDTLDTRKGKGHRLTPGGFIEMPAGMHHYAWSERGAVIQAHGRGPFAMTYVNPADDPSKK
jgi:anti-sigma factor ChrR (cupin superfamily)